MRSDDYCPQQDIVGDGNRYYRCSACNRRLWPRECDYGFQLPPHKPKGYKIAKLKAIQHKMRRIK